jgi:lipopolysaccharide/colanic/teichoic acid biosynthesis glycosyltransferase
MRDAADAVQRHVRHSRRLDVVLLDAGKNAAPQPAGASVMDALRFCDLTLKVLPPALLQHRKGYVQWGAHGRRPYDRIKRGLDILAAGVLLLLSVPFIAAAALGVALADGRPVLFRQRRVGLCGRRFSLLKFRTLREDSAPSLTPNDRIEERAFRFGRFLRRSRLDELPQLLNVLKGDMSMVGPRPEMEFFHERCALTIPSYRHRLVVRPGLTGWAQVRFSHTTTETDYWDKTAYDLWYVTHRSASLDAFVAFRTVGVLLFGKGAR